MNIPHYLKKKVGDKFPRYIEKYRDKDFDIKIVNYHGDYWEANVYDELLKRGKSIYDKEMSMRVGVMSFINNCLNQRSKLKRKYND